MCLTLLHVTLLPASLYRRLQLPATLKFPKGEYQGPKSYTPSSSISCIFFPILTWLDGSCHFCLSKTTHISWFWAFHWFQLLQCWRLRTIRIGLFLQKILSNWRTTFHLCIETFVTSYTGCVCKSYHLTWDIWYILNKTRQDDCQYIHDEVLYIYPFHAGTVWGWHNYVLTVFSGNEKIPY